MEKSLFREDNIRFFCSLVVAEGNVREALRHSPMTNYYSRLLVRWVDKKYFSRVSWGVYRVTKKGRVLYALLRRIR